MASRTEGLLAVVDSLIAALIIGPLVVGYWRGTWQLVDIYIFPDDLEKSAWSSFCFGAGVCTFFYFTQIILNKHCRENNILSWLIFVHLHTYIHGLGIVNYWRGVWLLLNNYTGTGINSSLISFAVGIGILAFLRSSRNVQAPPGLVPLDIGEATYECTTRFRTKRAFTEKHILDTLFTTIIIGGLIVFYWRGSWAYMDNVLYPEDFTRSAWVSVGIGYGGLLFCMLSQWPLSAISASLDDKGNGWLAAKVVIEDIFAFILNTSVVFIWRGIWYVCDSYIFPVLDDQGVYETYTLRSCWLTHALGQFGLMFLLAGNSVIVRGCQIDGEFKNGEGIILNIAYTNFFRKYWKQRKEDAGDGTKQHVDAKEEFAYDNTAVINTLSNDISSQNYTRTAGTGGIENIAMDLSDHPRFIDSEIRRDAY